MWILETLPCVSLHFLLPRIFSTPSQGITVKENRSTMKMATEATISAKINNFRRPPPDIPDTSPRQKLFKNFQLHVPCQEIFRHHVRMYQVLNLVKNGYQQHDRPRGERRSEGSTIIGVNSITTALPLLPFICNELTTEPIRRL